MSEQSKRPRRRPSRVGRPSVPPGDKRVPLSLSVHPETAKWLKTMSEGEAPGRLVERIVGVVAAGRVALPSPVCRRCGTLLDEGDDVLGDDGPTADDPSDPLLE